MDPSVTLHHFSVGCDIGGTFTDIVFLEKETGHVFLHKLLSTPDDPVRAVLEGIRYAQARFMPPDSRIDLVVHASTIANNLIFERKGAPIGLLTNAGFVDIIEMRRQERYDLYNIMLDIPKPLVPRRRRYGICGRIDSRGEIVMPLNLQDVDAAIADLVSQGALAVAICYLHSYRNPEHERQTAQRVREIAPQLSISVSSLVLPEIREYERTSTTVADAYVKPYVVDYLERLEESLLVFGPQPLRIMLSGGSTAPVSTARDFPVRMVESGPSAGVLAVQHYATMLGLTDCLAFDVGGTTAKAGLILGGKALKTGTYEIDHAQRFKKGSGIPLQLPAIHLLEMGAGGGSIVRLDNLGMLEVGPQSAGAMPGPACYQRGGMEPTVSDADLVLGYLDPDFFASGGMKLSLQAAENAISERIAKPLAIDVIAAAKAIHDLVNEKMAASIRMYCLENGEDPSRLTLVASGGAGPVHAYGVARKLGIRRVIISPIAGAMSAAGLLTAQTGFDLVRMVRQPLSAITTADMASLISGMRQEAANTLNAAPGELVLTALSADMRYVGQGFDVSVPLPEHDAGSLEGRAMAAHFAQHYCRHHGHDLGDTPAELTSLRVTLRERSGGIGAITRADKSAIQTVQTQAAATRRRLHFPQSNDSFDGAIHDRAALPPGISLNGPLVIRDPETASVVGPDCSVTRDIFGGLQLHLTSESAA